MRFGSDSQRKAVMAALRGKGIKYLRSNVIAGYHVTAAENLPSILKKGLQTRPYTEYRLVKGKHVTGTVHEVYFSGQPNWRAAAQFKDPPPGFNQQDKGKPMAVLRAALPFNWVVKNKGLVRAQGKRALVKDARHWPEFTTNRTVPPSRLKVVKTGL